MEDEINEVDLKESVALELTAKGQVKFIVKVRDKEITQQTLDRLKNIYDTLLNQYPNNTTKSI
jgi:hypothetical protein